MEPTIQPLTHAHVCAQKDLLTRGRESLMSKGWDDRADQWLAWARTPGFDAYWEYREAFLDVVLPDPGRATLEIGCGEGRVARDLAARGHIVTAIDASANLIGYAAALDPRSRYVVAPAETLPFGASEFDLVVAYNSLMDVDDMPQAVAEAARVLEPGGRLAACVTHPIADSGRFTSSDVDAPFVISHSYRGKRWFEGVEERDSLSMSFAGWSYDLESYSLAFEAAGFVFERLVEPMPSPPSETRWNRIPNFLMFRCLKLMRDHSALVIDTPRAR
jgi:SAM-dependent methyltransferase